MSRRRVLTYNFHEPYLCLMAKCGFDLEVGEYAGGPLARRWHTEYRPVPAGITLVAEGDWRKRLRTGQYDAVVAQNESNAADVLADAVAGDVPRLLVCHNRRHFLERNMDTAARAAYADLLEQLAQAYTFVFISQTKQDSYGIPGEVIFPGIDLADYADYSGSVAEILRVGNAMVARDCMFDVNLQEQVCAGLPHRIVGDNPELPAARPSRSWDDLRQFYQSRRCLLHVTREAYEDGYNLAMLEAMATGMPVVALANATAPLTDGVDGLIGADADALRAQCERLLGDLDFARAIGAAGRDAVASKFAISTFAQRWQEVIEKTASGATSRDVQLQPAHNPVATAPVLIEYMSSPFTTGRYVEAAARRAGHTVVTCGPRCPEALLRQWGFPGDIPHYPAQDIVAADYPETWAQFGAIVKDEHAADNQTVFLYVDSGRTRLAEGIGALPCPKVAWFIDTHIDAASRIEMARHFDRVFLAQQAQVPLFQHAGIAAEWLPLACDPTLHDLPPQERCYDVAYVGSLNDEDERRSHLLGQIHKRFPNCYIGKAWPADMAQIYAQSKIVVNAAVNRDVNMRVFEALASGALLITDEADDLEHLFEPGRDLVVYRDDTELMNLVAHYLDDDAARERIANTGRERVLAQHTYDRRWTTIIEMATSRSPLQGGARTAGGVSGHTSHIESKDAGRSSRLQSEYAPPEANDPRFESGGYYRSARPELMPHIPHAARRILDVGCGGGELGRALKARGALEVVGIEAVERAADLARRHLDDVLCLNVEQTELPFANGHFDCIVCADVLEHMVEPAAALRKLARVLRPGGAVVISIPNVRFFQVVAMLAEGRWRYEDAGIMDRTHLRFFTRTELAEMMNAVGLETQQLASLSIVPPEYLPLQPDRTVRIGRITISDITDTDYEELRTFQYLVIARKPVEAESHAEKNGCENGSEDIAEQFANLCATLASNFDDRDALFTATDLARRLGRLAEVRPHLQRYADFYPANVEAARRLVDVLRALGDEAAANARLQALHAIRPDAAAAHEAS